MTDKEIYLARQKGFERISNIVTEDTSEYFIDFMDYIHQIANDNEIDKEIIRAAVIEKADIRKKLIELFSK